MSLPAVRNVLFVDDEQDVLRGIRRLMREYRNDWNMDFVSSGAEALESLQQKSYDVVVSDMRMPGMNGVELMHEVQQQHPSVVRIVLSGDADRDSVINSVESTHQYLSKPCDPDVLKSTVARACALRDLLNSDSLKQVVCRISSIPSLPSIYCEVAAAIKDPEASIESIGKLIEQDVAMTAQLLKLVNSAYFGLPRPVSSASQAASVIGLEMIKSLVLSLGVFSQFDSQLADGFCLNSFQSHSQEVARLARQIAQAEGADKNRMSESYLSGFLHDVGKLILIENLPDEYGPILQHSSGEPSVLDELEIESFGASHADVGAYLLGLWGLPRSIVEAVAFHHCPLQLPVDEFNALTAVHVANALVKETETGASDYLDMQYISIGNWQPRLDEWRRQQMIETGAGG